MSLNKSTVGQRLREARTMRGYTLEQVAKAISMTPTTVSKYESNRVKTIPQKNLNAIASFLEVKPSYLLGYEDEEHASSNSLSIHEQLLIDDFRRLPVEYQKVVTELVVNLVNAQRRANADDVEQLTL